MTALPSILPSVAGPASASGTRDSFGASTDQGNGFADLLVNALGSNNQGMSDASGDAGTSAEAGTAQVDISAATAVLGVVPLVLSEALRQAALPNLGAIVAGADATLAAGANAGTTTDAGATSVLGLAGSTTASGPAAGFAALLTDNAAVATQVLTDSAAAGDAASHAEGFVSPTDADADTALHRKAADGTLPSALAGDAAQESAAPALSTSSSSPAGATPNAATGQAQITGQAQAGGQAQPGGIDISALTPVGAATSTSAPTLAAAPSASATAPAPVPVDQQVFPEVTRLVQRGDGSHRLTLTLSPEALGDVQVTLVVLKGAVTVSFAANDLAQRALLESAPELRRLLEMTGATDTRVVVRDAAAPAAAAQASSNTAHQGAQDGGQDSAAGADTHSQSEKNGRDAQADQLAADQFADHLAGRAREESQNQHARTRDGFTATDGTHRGTSPTGGPLNPDTATGYTRVDVTV